MRILHVYKDVHPSVPGGIERHIDQLRRHVPGVHSGVLICSRTRRTRVQAAPGGFEVAVAELGRPLSTPLAPGFPAWLRRISTDVLHLHMPNPTGEVAMLLARGGRPLVASYHADIVRQAALLPVYRPVVDRVLGQASAIVTGTAALRAGSPLLAGVRDRVEVIPYAVDTEWFDPAAVAAAERDELRARHGPAIILATGRLVYYKGFERLIRLATRLDASLVIAGGGPLEAALRVQAAAVPNVHLTGPVDDVTLRRWLAAADLFVLAPVNRAESFGIATLEAQAMGVPAVVGDVGTGTGEAIADGVTGLLVPSDDDEALVGALERLLADAGTRHRMGEAARERTLERHGTQAAGEAFAALYSRVA